MTSDERRERIHTVAEIIDDFTDEQDRFVLVVFPNKVPEDHQRTQFDIISSHRDKSYVLEVLRHVIEGMEHDLEQPTGSPKPN